MFRGLRHTLFLMLQLGALLSGAVALAIQPDAWPAILICVVGSILASILCERYARRYLRSTLGRLRRLTDDIGRGQPAPAMPVQPGDDFYKLVAAIQQVAARLAEARRAERRLNEELRRRERLAFLGELAATVAHEVNNPLDGLQSAARILRRSLDDPRRAQHMLDLIDSGLARIDLIVRRLLTLAREHVIRPIETPLADVVRRAVDSVADKFAVRGAAVRLDFTAADSRASADPQLLEQVFVNLLLNSLDSVGADGRVEIRIARGPRSDTGGATWQVDVSDNGCGIPADVLPHIFEPFFTTKSDGKGTGLGLPIAQRIVDAHRGQLAVESQPGAGTTFRVILPASNATATEQPLPGNSAPEPTSLETAAPR